MSDVHFNTYFHHTSSPWEVSESLIQPEVFLGQSQNTLQVLIVTIQLPTPIDFGENLIKDFFQPTIQEP